MMFQITNFLLFDRSSLSKMLQDVIEKKHDDTACQSNWKKNGSIFNQVPNTCQYFENCPHYSDLLVHEKRYKSMEIKYGLSKIDQVADFRIQLALFQGVKDEVMLGCRLSKDFDEPASKVQDL